MIAFFITTENAVYYSNKKQNPNDIQLNSIEQSQYVLNQLNDLKEMKIKELMNNSNLNYSKVSNEYTKRNLLFYSTKTGILFKEFHTKMTNKFNSIRNTIQSSTDFNSLNQINLSFNDLTDEVIDGLEII